MSWLKVVKSVRLVELVKLVSLHFFHIWTSNKAQNPLSFSHVWLGNVLRATTACTFSTFERQKVVQTPRAFTLLTWKCASRHNGGLFFDNWTSKSGMNAVCFAHFDLEKFASRHNNVLFFDSSTSKRGPNVRCFTFFTYKCASRHNGAQFFDSSTSKSGSNMVCFVHFDLEMCFAPQRRALFRHLNFQKWSEHCVFCTFWLGHVLRATTVCNFSTSQLPKVVWTRCVLHILIGKNCFAPQRRVIFRQLNFQKGSEREVFYLFYLQMCFAPQRRAIFRQLNFQKWFEHGVFCTFWLGNVLRATTACNFCQLNFQKWSDHEVFLPILLTNVLRTTTACNCSSLIWPADSAPAALARLLFDPPEPQIIGKAQWIATFLPFRASASSCFPVFLFSDLFTSWLLLPDSSHYLSVSLFIILVLIILLMIVMIIIIVIIVICDLLFHALFFVYVYIYIYIYTHIS